MSIAGILSSSLLNLSARTVTSPRQRFQQEFQQLGQDLQAGNLSAAQADFATLPQNAPSSSATALAQSSNPIIQAFNRLGQDLQSANLSAAQQDYSTVQRDVQSQSIQTHHHHRHSRGAENSAGNQRNTIAQEFSQLSQALQSGNLSAAQQAYRAVQQSFEAFAGHNALALAASASTSTSGGVQTTA